MTKELIFEILKTTLGVIITTALGYLFGLITSFVKKNKETEKSYKLIQDGIMILLKDSIDDTYETYEQLGYCPTEVKAEVEKTFRVYEKMGGNGLGRQHYHELMEMKEHK